MSVRNRVYYHYEVKTCPDCWGSGRDFGDGGQCDRCNGTGEIEVREEDDD